MFDVYVENICIKMRVFFSFCTETTHISVTKCTISNSIYVQSRSKRWVRNCSQAYIWATLILLPYSAYLWRKNSNEFVADEKWIVRIDRLISNKPNVDEFLFLSNSIYNQDFFTKFCSIVLCPDSSSFHNCTVSFSHWLH